MFIRSTSRKDGRQGAATQSMPKGKGGWRSIHGHSNQGGVGGTTLTTSPTTGRGAPPSPHTDGPHQLHSH